VPVKQTTASVLDTLLQQCEVIGTCEQLVAAGEAHASVAATLPFGPEQLPLLLSATEELLVAQAKAFRRCADEVRAVDAILARYLRRLADKIDSITGTELAITLREAGELARADDAALAA
jgi:nitrogenase molybdenum-iron protein alpha/beta subunit